MMYTIYGIIYNDVFPSDKMTDIFINDITNTLRILPLNDLSKTDLIKKYNYYSPGFIDLNKISSNYTPNVIGDYTFTEFKPILQTYMFNNHILGSSKINNKIGKSIIHTIYNNIPTINKMAIFIKNPLNKYNMVNDSLLLPLNKGVIEFYINKGYITYEDDIKCKYFVGNKKCDKKNISLINNLMVY